MAEAVVPRKASTLVLLRQGEDVAFEVFMTRRPLEMRFLGGFYVFPGGGVRPDDYSEAMLRRCRGLAASDAHTLLDQALAPEQCLGHWVAAIRELYEEAGILLCVSREGGTIGFEESEVSARLRGKRESLIAGNVSFLELLESEDLYCDLGSAVYFFHRITPDHYRMRFDTRFYLAVLPLGQRPLAVSQEVVESLWIAPAEALRRFERGRMPLIPPTVITLSTLAAFSSWQALCAEYDLRR